MMAARLLDLTRLLSRQGKGPMTGIDRVEHAYLSHLLAGESPVFGLLRSAMGFLLLGRSGMQLLRDDAAGPPRASLLRRLAYRHDPSRAVAESALARHAIDRCTRAGLRRMLARHLPPGSSYLNTGHANLDDPAFRQMAAAGLKITVLIHDTLPLDHPEYTRPDMVAPFRRKMQVVSRHADLVVHTTQDARQKTEAWFHQFGRVPDAIVATLGVDVAQANPAALPFTAQPPYFVCLGTIEPRKNHALLLDVWDRLPPPAPRLYIVGKRGWSNEAVFARLDRLPPDSAVREVAGLADGAVTALLQQARALLFPSLAEGFGLPALEAAALGTPVIASNLPVFHETVGDFAVYLDPHDSYSWLETIIRLVGSPSQERRQISPPTWQDHFKAVLIRA